MAEDISNRQSYSVAAACVPRTFTDVLVWSTSRVAELLEVDRGARLQALLSGEEQARHQAFLLEQNRAEFLLAHAAKRFVLARRLGVPPTALEFVTDSRGKPSLTTSFGRPPIGFSLSHSHGAVAVAVSATPAVGVDVERVSRRISPRALMAALSDREAAMLDRLPERDRRRRLFAYWTAREAFSKAVGLGLRLPREEVAFLIADNGDVRFEKLDAKHGLPSSWHIRQRWLSGDCVLTAIIRTATGTPPVWRFHDFQTLATEWTDESLPAHLA